VRFDLYVPKCYEEDFVKFKELLGKGASREICYMIRRRVDDT